MSEDTITDPLILDRHKRIANLGNPNNRSLAFTGTENEKTGAVDGLERAKVLTGFNSFQIGDEYQNAYNNVKKRTQLQDTGSELLRANKAGAIADARNQMQQQGVKGGSALGAVAAVERAKSFDVNNLLQQNQKDAETAYMNAAKGNANFTNSNEINFRALASNKDFQLAPGNSNGFGFSVICTELFNQGYFSLDIYLADKEYGIKVLSERPHVYFGYRLLADPIVALMQKSKTITQIVAFFALPWAKNMAGKKNTFGKLISLLGEPFCGLVGKLFWRNKYANKKA